MENILKTVPNKPISAGTHGLMDYGFALSLIAIPVLTGADKKTKKMYTIIH